MIDLSVDSVMTQSVCTVTPETTVCDVATLFDERDIGSAVVTDPDTGEPSGIVTESDLMEHMADGTDIASIRVKTVLSTPLITIPSTENIKMAASLMRDHSIEQVPVLDGDELVGILTTTDLTHYIPRFRDRVGRERTPAH